MNTASCLYEGTLRHRRTVPAREFDHPLALFYIDLGELPKLLDGRLLRRSFGTLRLRRRDYHGPQEVPLVDAVRDTVRQQTGHRPAGPVRMLTNVRTFGHCFNPVTFYYCYRPGGTELEAVLAEVNNTPWGQRHAYVVPGGYAEFDKAMHVSPFIGMDYRYHCRADSPGESLAISIDNRCGGETAFRAQLVMHRTELNPRTVRRFLRRYPFASLRVLALIYAHAIGLKLAGARVHPHPERSTS